MGGGFVFPCTPGRDEARPLERPGADKAEQKKRASGYHGRGCTMNWVSPARAAGRTSLLLGEKEGPALCKQRGRMRAYAFSG